MARYQRQLDYYGGWYYEEGISAHILAQEFGSGYRGVIVPGASGRYYWGIEKVGNGEVAHGRADSPEEAVESAEAAYANIAADDAEKRRERYLASAVPERRPVRSYRRK